MDSDSSWKKHARPPMYQEVMLTNDTIHRNFWKRYHEREIPGVVFNSTDLHALNTKFKDISELYIKTSLFDKFEGVELSRLTFLSIDNNYHDLDLSHFPQLNRFNCTWHKKITNLGHLRDLEHLDITSLLLTEKPLALPPQVKTITLRQSKLKDFKEVVIPDTVTQLRLIHNRSLRSLEGLEHLDNLERLHLATNSKVEDLDILACFPNLKWLRIEGQKKVKNLDIIRDLKELIELDIFDCNEIDSFKFIDNHSSLRYVGIIGTYSASEKVSFLNKLNFDYLRVLPHKKHYDAKIIWQKNIGNELPFGPLGYH